MRGQQLRLRHRHRDPAPSPFPLIPMSPSAAQGPSPVPISPHSLVSICETGTGDPAPSPFPLIPYSLSARPAPEIHPRSHFPTFPALGSPAVTAGAVTRRTCGVCLAGLARRAAGSREQSHPGASRGVPAVPSRAPCGAPVPSAFPGPDLPAADQGHYITALAAVPPFLSLASCFICVFQSLLWGLALLLPSWTKARSVSRPSCEAGMAG